MDPTVIVVMGASGSGKSTVGAALADELSWDFVDGDDLHPAANVDKMRHGVPLEDADRLPWLDRLHELISTRVEDRDPLVLASSALKRRYRDRLGSGLATGALWFVHLDADADTLARRLRQRRGHYMPPSLLESQLADLEPPGPDEPALVVDATRTVAAVLDDVVARLGSGIRRRSG